MGVTPPPTRPHEPHDIRLRQIERQESEALSREEAGELEKGYSEGTDQGNLCRCYWGGSGGVVVDILSTPAELGSL